MYIPGYPYHIVHRGNNREACFIEPENYQFSLDLWKECSKRYGILVIANCLMTNHIYFLAITKRLANLPLNSKSFMQHPG
jgi:putative transposase